MSRPIVIAHHLLWTAYGWWLPNDPRGSTSKTIASDVLNELGELHFGRKKIQPTGNQIRAFYTAAEPLLKFPLLTLEASDISIVAESLSQIIAQHRYTCYACAIMWDHVHILLRKHRHSAEEMIDLLQTETRDAMRCAKRRVHGHPLWSSGGWKVFLDHPNDVRRTIRYIEENPVKMRLPVQRWGFVKEYDGWPLHPGHSPNSPYARRLREATDW